MKLWDAIMASDLGAAERLCIKEGLKLYLRAYEDRSYKITPLVPQMFDVSDEFMARWRRSHHECGVELDQEIRKEIVHDDWEPVGPLKNGLKRACDKAQGEES